MTKVGIPFQELLLDDDRMSEAAGSVAKLDDAKAAITIVDAQQCNPLQAEFAVDMPREAIALHSIILKIGEVPGNDGLRYGRIGGGAVNDWRFGFKREAQSDVGRLRTDGAENGPDLILVNHSNGIVRGRAPNR